MLRLDPLKIIQQFRRPGGADFVEFVNELIRTICWEQNVPASAISTCTRTDARDGGVDTRVGQGSQTEPTGYLRSSSVWQFKAADEDNVSAKDMEEEVNKPHAKSCLAQGDAYRMCICAHLTDEKRIDLLNALRRAIKEINPESPECFLLAVEDLAALADRYPAFVMRLDPSIAAICQHFQAWGASATGVTPTFVPSSSFEPTSALIVSHINLHALVPDPVLLIEGDAGVGKTRTVYESLLSVTGARNLVLYTDDEEHAVELANIISNDPIAHAILVADECSIAAREQLTYRARGCPTRLRIIAIHNSAELLSTFTPELKIEKMSSGELENILRANFPGVAADRLRSYSHLAEGFVRLAADMCRFDPQIKVAGSISPVIASVHGYYQLRLKPEQRTAVEAIALLRRVGHKGDASGELDALCAMIKLDRNLLEQQLAAIKDAPGFVERGAKYYRVTPEIIAIVAFENAWKRLAEGHELVFLSSLPDLLQQSFLQRVSGSARPEVRNTVQTFFRNFAGQFQPGDLANLSLVNRFVVLVETHPSFYLPVLRAVIESASHEQLTSSPEWAGSSWGPRRQLVWLAERLAQFAEFFRDCEAILYHLAVHECEPKIGNNATAIWQRFFRLHLSGTSLDLKSRLEILSRRIEESDEESGKPISGAFKKILDFHGGRVLGPPVVAGRIPPKEWQPETWGEMKSALVEAVTFLKKVAEMSNEALGSAAETALLDGIDTLLRRGYLDQVVQSIPTKELSEEARAKLVSRVKQFMDYSAGPQTIEIPNEYLVRLTAWVEEAQPTSLHGRLVETVGPDSWSHYGREEQWRAALGDLAELMLSDEASFAAELPWLASEEARSAFDFGQTLGAKEKTGDRLDKIVHATFVAKNSTLLKGYLSGLLYNAKIDPTIVNSLLDGLEIASPLFAFDVSLVCGDLVAAFTRATRLVREHKLPAAHLRVFTFWVGNRRVTTDEVVEALRLLLEQSKSGVGDLSDVMIDFLGASLHSGKLGELVTANPALVWGVLQTAAVNPGRESFWWGEVLARVAHTQPTLAVHLASNAMLSENYRLAEEAEKLVTQLAPAFPKEIMEELGRVMLEKETGWRFLIGKFPVFTSIPQDVIIQWLRRSGAEGSRKIARHLPSPFLAADGKPSLHPLTEFVLKEFEDDEDTFDEFCAGVHTLQLYTGDIAAAREKEATLAQAFFNHPLKRVREWAQREWASAHRDAELHRLHDDELA